MPDDSAAAHPPPDAPTAAPRGDPLWDDWDTPPRVPTIPVLHLDGFDGPMDLLLDLAERQRIDLGRISVVALVEQFVAAMDRLTTQVPVERRADWVVVATRLVLLRSQLMFPGQPETPSPRPSRRPPARSHGWTRCASSGRRRPGCRSARSSATTCSRAREAAQTRASRRTWR